MDSLGFKNFSEDRTDRFKVISHYGSRFYGISLYLLFWIADWIYAPNLKWEFLAYRLIVVSLICVVNPWVQRCRTLAAVQWTNSIYTVILTGPIVTMIFKSGDGGSPYYAGLMLVAFGICIWPWTLRFFLLQNAIIFLPFYLGPFLFLKHTNWVSLALNSFFLIGTATIVAVVYIVTESLRRLEYQQRLLRHRELLNRDRIIVRKTKEQTHLERLSRQFSPQVIASIKSGKLSVDHAPEKKDICALVVDICGYTLGCRRLPADRVHTVLNMFYNSCVKRFFKYDITFDKTIGDAVLGFSNEPEKHNDYVARVAQAAAEIMQDIEYKQAEFMVLWEASFQIKIGISQGQALVGFFGDGNSPKNYTASGEVMNLTARISAMAKPGEIVMTAQTAEVLQLQAKVGDWASFNLQSKGMLQLKGYEDQAIEAFALLPSSQNSGKLRLDCPDCPNGHGQLHLGENSKGQFAFKCRVCDFEANEVVDMTASQILKKAA